MYNHENNLVQFVNFKQIHSTAGAMMYNNKEKQLNRELSIKSKLVNSRKIIRNKFKKAYSDRISRETDRKEKYQPITKAIDKLAESRVTQKNDNKKPLSDWSDWNDDIANNERGKAYSNIARSMSSENWDASSDSEYSDMDFSEGQESETNNFEQASSSHMQSESKRMRGSNEDVSGNMSTINEDDETLVQSTSDGKRSRLSKGDYDKYHKSLDKKANKKIREMQRVNSIFEEVVKNRKEKKNNERDVIHLISDSEDDTDDDDNSIMLLSDEEIPTNRNPATKRSNSSAITPNKFVRVPLSIDRKLSGRYSADELRRIRRVPTFFQSKKKQKIPVTVIHVPAINNPYLTMEDVVKRRGVAAKGGEEGGEAIAINTNVVKKTKKKKKKAKTGNGIETDFVQYNENIVHEFYDDPNELCERLRLLIASRAAGNSNHAQEINSIISELRESNIIF